MAERLGLNLTEPWLCCHIARSRGRDRARRGRFASHLGPVFLFSHFFHSHCALLWLFFLALKDQKIRGLQLKPVKKASVRESAPLLPRRCGVLLANF